MEDTQSFVSHYMELASCIANEMALCNNRIAARPLLLSHAREKGNKWDLVQ